MANNNTLDKDVPSWNGLEDSWADYVREVEWLTYSAPEKFRDLLAPKLARKLSGSAKQAIKDVKPRDLLGLESLDHIRS